MPLVASSFSEIEMNLKLKHGLFVGLVGLATLVNAQTLLAPVIVDGIFVPPLSTGSSGTTSIGTIDSQTPAANGAVISGTALYMQSASSSVPGLVNATTQTFAGSKTFSEAVIAASGVQVNVGGNSTGLTDLLINPTTKASGNLMDLQVNGTSKFKVDNSGLVSAGSDLITSGNVKGSAFISTAANVTTVLGNRGFTSGGSVISLNNSSTHTNNSATVNIVAITPIYNQSGTAAATDLLINRTETAIGSGAQLAIQTQVGGADRFVIDHTGAKIGSQVVSQLATPAAPTGTPSTTGGSMAAGTTYVANIVALDSLGSVAGTQSATVTIASGSTGSIAWAWTAVTGANSYQIWVADTVKTPTRYYTSTTNSYLQTAQEASGTSGTMPSGNTTGQMSVGVVTAKQISISGGTDNSFIGGGLNANGYNVSGSHYQTHYSGRVVDTGTTAITIAASKATTYLGGISASGVTITLAAPSTDGERRRIVFANASTGITGAVTSPATTTAGLPTTVTAGQAIEIVYNSVAGTPTNSAATTWYQY